MGRMWLRARSTQTAPPSSREVVRDSAENTPSRRLHFANVISGALSYDSPCHLFWQLAWEGGGTVGRSCSRRARRRARASDSRQRSKVTLPSHTTDSKRRLEEPDICSQY